MDWDTYVRLADDLENASCRFTYDAPTRRLEVEMPNGFLHECTSRQLALLVTAFARERGIRTRAVGSISLRQRRRGGADGDEAFYVGNLDRLPGRRTNVLDLAGGQAPPDLVIEVDVTSPGLSKLPIYARLGVKEVWVWADDAIAVYRPAEAGVDEPVAASVILPGFPLAFAAALLRDRPDAADAELQDALVEHLRGAGGP